MVTVGMCHLSQRQGSHAVIEVFLTHHIGSMLFPVGSGHPSLLWCCSQAVKSSAVRIVFFHFESNRIVFAVLKSRDVKFVFS